MKNKFKLSVLLLALLSITLWSCKDDDDPAPSGGKNEEEEITTMTMTFIDLAGVEPTKVFTFRDPDGEGGNAPTQFDTVELTNGTVYNVMIGLLNEAETPTDTVTNEIIAEADEHLFCYTPTGTTTTVAYSDTDGGGLPIGLITTWTAGTAGMGTMNTTLKHQPDGLKDGTCAPGDSDIDLDWVLKIN